MKYYLAYGSNLSVNQMLHRCPDAVYVGCGFLRNRRLLFRRGFLTVEPKAGRQVPVLVWRVSEKDEKALDRYEGFPRFYRKEEVTLDVFGFLGCAALGPVDAFMYVMNDGYPLGAPTAGYWATCREGYDRFGFDWKILKKALDESAPEA